jgi:hypothetical protein
VAFITTIIATLIGGVLAVGTSVVVKRWEYRQETRIRMFDELLPETAANILAGATRTEGPLQPRSVKKSMLAPLSYTALLGFLVIERQSSSAP